MKKLSLIFLLSLLVFLLNAGTPKYVFLMIGDGMGPGTVQIYNELFPENNLKKFAAPVLTGTNNIFGKTTDSAASGTALACGIKTYNKSIGMDKDGKPVSSLAKLLQKRQWKIGIISSVGINDATPATHYANRKRRDEYTGIISEIGLSNFDFFGISMLKGMPDSGMEQLKRVLLRSNYQIVDGKSLSKLKAENKNAVIAGTNVVQLKPGSPRLCDVAAKAAELLSSGNNRFFMMVEGGAVDHANHANDAGWSMLEMMEFDAAIGAALRFAARYPEDTLIIVTADHDTGGLTLKDPARIDKKFYLKQKTSLAGLTSLAVKLKAEKLPATRIIEELAGQLGIENITAEEQKRLNYACELFLAGKTTRTDKFTAGMGYGRYNPLAIEILRTRDRRNGFCYTSFAHTAARVTTFAKGPGSEYFKAPLENSDIPHRIAAAIGMPELLKNEGNTTPFPPLSKAADGVKIQSVGFDRMVMRYSFENAAEREFVLSSGKRIKTTAAFGRICFDGLTPDTAYTVALGERKWSFRTSVKPRGKLLFKAAVISDPHLSVEVDKARRMHSRSGTMLEQMADKLAADRIELLFIPGDLTDTCSAAELKLAMNIFKNKPFKIFCTPGNHDRPADESVRKLWNEKFGPGSGMDNYRGVQLLKLDTCTGKLGTPENIAAVKALDPVKPAIIIAHHLLFPDQYIYAADKRLVISDRNTPEVKAMLEKLSRCNAIAWVGHKNVASPAVFGQLRQFNSPQLTEYPIGALALDVYESGVLMSFIPVPDQFVEEYARRRFAAQPELLKWRTATMQRGWNSFIPWPGSKK